MNNVLLDRAASPISPEMRRPSPPFPSPPCPAAAEGGEHPAASQCERVTIRTASAIIESPRFLPFCASPGAVAEAVAQWARAIYEGDERRRVLMDERVLIDEKILDGRQADERTQTERN